MERKYIPNRAAATLQHLEKLYFAAVDPLQEMAQPFGDLRNLLMGQPHLHTVVLATKVLLRIEISGEGCRADRLIVMGISLFSLDPVQDIAHHRPPRRRWHGVLAQHPIIV